MSDHPKEACGIVGIYAPGQDVARIAYFALLALQHRGEESAGIAVSDGSQIYAMKEMGLVTQVFNDNQLNALSGDLAMGHVRYSTTGSSSWENSQPILKDEDELYVGIAHNGNLVNTMDLLRDLDARPGAPTRRLATSDSDLIAEMVVRSKKASIQDAILDTLPKLKGAFSLVMMDEKRVYGARDPNGFRPLVLGALDRGGFVLVSETCALPQIGAKMIREVQPGELVVIDESGVSSHRFAPAHPSLCIFEFVYFSRADSAHYGKSVLEARYEMGRRLAREAPVDADLVMPVPDSGRSAAQGYAAECGIAYGEGLIRNYYVGRSFIQPIQAIREQRVRTKLNPLPEVLKGKRLVVVEDSIVRATTTRQLVQMLRDAGAAEVHLRISSPPIRWPCFYGIDMGSFDQLIAAHKTVDEVREHVNADSLAYLSLDGMVDATEVAGDMFCTACFSSRYPVPVEDAEVGKHMLEASAPQPPAPRA